MNIAGEGTTAASFDTSSCDVWLQAKSNILRVTDIIHMNTHLFPRMLALLYSLKSAAIALDHSSLDRIASDIALGHDCVVLAVYHHRKDPQNLDQGRIS